MQSTLCTMSSFFVVAMHIEDTQRLVTEIEMLRVVLRLVRRDIRARFSGSS
jgi:ABC-type polysaccharide/polyol phosphate export permease